MTRKKKMEDLRAAKDRKMKKVAIGLAVVFVAILAIQVPKLMKGSGSSAAPLAATTTSTDATSGGTTAPATTPPGTAAAAVTPAASSKLPNSDTTPRVGKSQLYAFTHFAGKDPFVQQVVDATAGLPDGESSSSSSSTASSTPSASSGTTAKVTHVHHSRTLAVTGAARISVNGRVQIVTVGKSFPSANPLFRLVSASGGVAKVGIAGGKYSSGAKTVSLVAGRTLTLVDTADGIRYKLRLLSA